MRQYIEVPLPKPSFPLLNWLVSSKELVVANNTPPQLSTDSIVAQSKVVNTLIAHCVGVSEYHHSHSVVIPMQ